MFYKFKKNQRSTSTLQKSLTDIANSRQKHNQIDKAKFHKNSHGSQNVQKLQFANIVKVMNRKNKINLHSSFQNHAMRIEVIQKYILFTRFYSTTKRSYQKWTKRSSK